MTNKVRVHNLAQGGRGGYIGGEPFEVAAGSVRTFEAVSDEDLALLNGKRHFRVQTFKAGNWVDEAETSIPKEKPYLAIASGAKGEKMRIVELAAGESYVGMVRASDRPDNALGYEWVKIGGAVDAVVDPVVETEPTEPRRPGRPPKAQ